MDIFLLVSLEDKMRDIKNETVAQRIKELRIQNGYTLESVGKRIGVTKSAVQYWESGLNVPTLDKIAALAELFKVSIDYIAGIASDDVIKVSHLTYKQKELIRGMVKYLENVKEE